jgi:hypothetical protein
MYTTYQLSTGPTRTGQTQATRRFQPYGTSRTRAIEYANAEAGPSTLAPPPVPYLGPPAPEPSGGLLSETSADAEQPIPISENDEVPVSALYRSHIPHKTEWLFSVKRRSGQEFPPPARQNLADTASRQRALPPAYWSGRRRKWRARNFRASMRLWQVSICHV